MNRMEVYLDSERGKQFLENLYGKRTDVQDDAVNRYHSFYKRYTELFDEEKCVLVNVPGRVEVSGNHTDHNRGKVLAGSISLDAVALCSPSDEMTVVLHDLTYRKTLKVDLSALEKSDAEEGHPEALIRGVAAGLQKKGYRIGGFKGIIRNNVMSGSGLSSSAVFETAVGAVFSVLYNNNDITPVELAKTGQYAENVFFGKPCGLMDQTACAVGGLIFIDFKDPDNPRIDKISQDLTDFNLIVVKTGGDHAELTEEYAAIPREMKCTASIFGKEVLREITMAELIDQADEIRKKCGDRAFLRSLHFFTENMRVEEQKTALERGEIGKFLSLVNESGTSSWKNLQNVSVEGNPLHQDMAVSLAVTGRFIKEKGRGASRVHGGGFAGTILCFIHRNDTNDYIDLIEKVTGKESTTVLSIRETGIITVEL